jgi:hypothetical protein
VDHVDWVEKWSEKLRGQAEKRKATKYNFSNIFLNLARAINAIPTSSAIHPGKI